MKNIFIKIISICSLIVIGSIFTLFPVYANDDKKVFMQMNSKGEIYKSYTSAEDENKELPIETTIRYYLDGIETQYNDIKGKSGKVKIEINYENKDKQTVNVNGKIQTVSLQAFTIKFFQLCWMFEIFS